MSRARKSKRPESVRILGRDFSVTYDLDNGNYGRCDQMMCEIEVMDGLPPVEERDTVLHEIMHGVWDKMDIGNHRVEEHVIRKMATGLIQVLQDNPGLAAYLAQSDN